MHIIKHSSHPPTHRYHLPIPFFSFSFSFIRMEYSSNDSSTKCCWFESNGKPKPFLFGRNGIWNSIDVRALSSMLRWLGKWTEKKKKNDFWTVRTIPFVMLSKCCIKLKNIWMSTVLHARLFNVLWHKWASNDVKQWHLEK